MIEAAGFEAVEFAAVRYDTFAGAPQTSDAEEFGTKGVDIRARKAVS